MDNIFETNIDDIVESESTDLINDFDAIVNKKENTNFNVRKDVDYVKSLENEKPKYIEITWQMYRAGSFLIVFICIFLAQAFYNLFEKKYPNPYILRVLKIILFFLLLNLASFLFIFTYYKYRENVKGPKGEKGVKGKRGFQGKNTYCDISKKKYKTLTKLKKNTNRKYKIVNGEDKPPVDKTKITEFNKEKYPTFNYTEQDNQVSGIGCSDSTCKYKLIDFDTDNTKKKPLIGVNINFNSNNGLIHELQYNIDNNKFYNKKNYKVALHGENNDTNKYIYTPNSNDDVDADLTGKFGIRVKNKNIKQNNFVCKNNSAIYKIDTIYDDEGLKGLKYYCQDIDTGKSTKSLNNNGEEKYGVVFGKEPKPGSENYLFKTLKCENYYDKKNEIIKPSFISDVGAEYNDKNIKNIRVRSCVYKK